jgi:hypothetical protein
MSKTWNVNAAEFTPVVRSGSFRADAAEFVPVSQTVSSELVKLISNSMLRGIRVSDIPKKYFAVYGKVLDLTMNLSDFLEKSAEGVYLEEGGDDATLHGAFRQAGFMIPDGFDEESNPDDEIAHHDVTASQSVVLGSKADHIARHVMYHNYVPDLACFKQMIIDVVSNFCTKTSILTDNRHSYSPTGLALSLFAAEWDRYHFVRGLGSDLRELRNRFGAIKLMPFLQATPELEVVGTHPEVRVRTRPGVAGKGPVSPKLKSVAACMSTNVSPNVSLNESIRSGHTARSTISLNSELFGEEDKPDPSEQTRSVLESMMTQSQNEILTILSTVPHDPVQAASAIQKVNELQVLVNALKAALAVLPTPVAPKSTTKTISLDSMLEPPIEEPAAVAPVGSLLAELSRILFAQVIQQQQSVPEAEAVAETTAALERTLADIVVAASTPPSSPIGEGHLIIPRSLPTSPIVAVSAPFSGTTTPQTLSLSNALGISDDSTAAMTPNMVSPMDQLLRGLVMGSSSKPMAESSAPPGLTERSLKSTRTADVMRSVVAGGIVGKQTMVGALQRLRRMECVAAPPVELEGLSCREAAPRISHKITTPLVEGIQDSTEF